MQGFESALNPSRTHSVTTQNLAPRHTHRGRQGQLTPVSHRTNPLFFIVLLQGRQSQKPNLSILINRVLYRL